MLGAAGAAGNKVSGAAERAGRPLGLTLGDPCGIGPELFHKIVAGAAMDAEVDAAILQRLEGAPDHPTTMVFPEGEYLKGLALLRM